MPATTTTSGSGPTSVAAWAARRATRACPPAPATSPSMAPRVAPGQLGRVVEDRGAGGAGPVGCGRAHAGAVPGFSASSISMTGMSSRTGYR